MSRNSWMYFPKIHFNPILRKRSSSYLVPSLRFSNQLLNNFFFSPHLRLLDLIVVMGICVARIGEGRGVHRVLVGKPEGKRPLGRLRRRWEDNIKMDLQEVGGSCGDWMELAQDRDRWRALVGTVRNLRDPKMRGISWLAAEPVSFSRRTLLHGVSK